MSAYLGVNIFVIRAILKYLLLFKLISLLRDVLLILVFEILNMLVSYLEAVSIFSLLCLCYSLYLKLTCCLYYLWYVLLIYYLIHEICWNMYCLENSKCFLFFMEIFTISSACTPCSCGHVLGYFLPVNERWLLAEFCNKEYSVQGIICPGVLLL